jgi:hypothetical protein
LLTALVLAVRFRDTAGLRLVAVAGAGCVACVVACAQIRGTAPEYLILWSRAVAMLNAAAPFVVLARRYAPELVRRRSGARLALAAAAALAAVPICARAWYARVPQAPLSRAYEAIIPLALGAFPAGASVRLTGAGVPFAASPHALLVALERSGRSGRTRTFHRLEVGEHRTVADGATLPTLLLVMSTDAIAVNPARRVVGQHDPLSHEQRAEAVRLRGRLEGALRAMKRTDLLLALHVAAPWLAERAPPELDRAELERYLELASGEDKIAWVLYASPPGPL